MKSAPASRLVLNRTMLHARTLTDEQKALVKAVYVEKASMDEVSRRFGITHAAVSVRLCKIIQTVRRNLSDEAIIALLRLAT